jgi:carbamate kinase
MFLTGVDNVVLDYGTGHEIPLERITVEDAKLFAEQGQFSVGSMLPKIDTSIDFITSGTGRLAVITSMEKAKESLAGKAGTTICQ